MPRTRAAFGLGAALLVALPAGPGLPAEPLRLAMPVVYGTHLPGLGEPAARLAKLVKQLSGGAIELDLKEPGDGTEPQEILDKVSRGQFDVGFATANFWAAKVPATVRRLSVWARRQGLCRLVLRRQRTNALPGDV